MPTTNHDNILTWAIGILVLTALSFCGGLVWVGWGLATDITATQRHMAEEFVIAQKDIADTLHEIDKRVARIELLSGDRWTRSDHDRYATRLITTINNWILKFYDANPDINRVPIIQQPPE